MRRAPIDGAGPRASERRVWDARHISVAVSSPSVLRARSRPLTDALWLSGVGAFGVAALQVALILWLDVPFAWLTALYPVVGLAYVVIGLHATRRRPSSRLGLLLVLAGGAIFLAALAAFDAPAAYVLGAIPQTLVFALIAQLLLAFPTGRLPGRTERVVVVAGYVVCLVLQAPAYLYGGIAPLAIADRPDLVELGLQVQRAAGATVVAATGVLLVARMRRASAEQRRVLVPLSVYGMVALVFIPVSSALNDAVFHAPPEWLGVSQLTVVALVPLVFAAAASRGGFERTADIAELGAWLGAEERGRAELREALATTLGDPSVQLLFRVPGEDGLVDDRGLPVPAAAPTSGRGVVDVVLGGQVVGAIAYDAMLLDRPEEIREAGRIVALALDRQRLEVELRASRARIAAAADDERRRIARDLHDGLQSRLVHLAIQAETGDRTVLRQGIQSAIDEVRELVDGVMPAQLTESGLPAAIEDLGDRLPMPIELRVAGLEQRLRPDVETAAYFVVSEAIVNAIKHAKATALTVSLERSHDRLRLDVADDGSGRLRPGSGVQGMADRVAALGGEFSAVGMPGSGTRVVAVIPYADQ